VAVAKMRRVEVIGYRPVLDAVLEELQRLGALQVTAGPEGLETEGFAPEDERRRVLDEYAADARFVRDFLARYHTPTQPFATFVSEKFHFSVEEFERLEGGTALLHLYRACDDLADRLASLERERQRLLALVKDLEPWLQVHLQIDRFRGTDHVALFTGTVPSTDGTRIRAQLREVSPYVSVEEYGGAGLRTAWIVLVHRCCVDEVRSALSATRFVEVTFPGLSDYPAQESAIATERLSAIGAELTSLHERAASLSAERYDEAAAIVEAIAGDHASAVVRDSIGRTQSTFVATGWVPAAREAELEGALQSFGGDLDVAFSDPTDEDDPPVELDNPRWLKPFEVLTDLYGRPAYREIDPTPLLAPFFLLFFSICVSDVGYGAMLIAGAWLIKHRLDVAPTVKRFMDLMMWGGAGAMAVGVVFASYFALPVEALPAPLRALQILDPLAQLPMFLIATIVLGVVQVFFGVGISAYDSIRRGDTATAVAEQLSTIFMFAMVGTSVAVWSANPAAGKALLVVGLLGTILLQGRSLETALNGKDLAAWDRAVGLAWLALMLAWIVSLALGGPSVVLWVLLGVTFVGLFVSKAVRKGVVAFLGGAYAVYGMSAFLGDVLSYARLAALGLSGALVGMVFNLLAGMVWEPAGRLWVSGGAGWLWAALVVVAATAVFVFGHVFNVVINLLGAFVHPARLQFVEFFGKFYEGGGKSFAPFRLVTKSVVLHAGAARQEGGTGS
jgi:V/A-type H+-transporting ATPase subunit I